MAATERTGTQPFFSVVIPVYNKAAYLQATVDSVLRQSFHDFELLLIIDKSTDGSEQLAESFTDGRIRIYKRDTPGPGGYAARNLGIEKAATSWIAFLDADDVWEVDFLTHIHAAIVAQAGIQVFCSGFSVGNAQRPRPHQYYRKFTVLGSHAFSFEEFLVLKPIHTSSVVIGRDLLLELGGFPAGRFKRGGDSETWLRVMNRCHTGFWINYLGARYDNQIADSVINVNNPYLLDHPVRLLVAELLQKPENKPFARALKRHANSFMFPGLRALGRKQALSPGHFKALYYDATLWRGRLAGMFLLAFFPSPVQRLLVKAFKK